MGSGEVKRLRPTIFTADSPRKTFPDRPEEFQQAEARIKWVLEFGRDWIVEVVEGMDDLCVHCPPCREGCCQSPEGNEVQIRKWTTSS